MQLSGMVALSIRGECDFTAKAEIAQAGGAAALLVINNEEGYIQSLKNLEMQIKLIYLCLFYLCLR